MNEKFRYIICGCGKRPETEYYIDGKAPPHFDLLMQASVLSCKKCGKTLRYEDKEDVVYA